MNTTPPPVAAASDRRTLLRLIVGDAAPSAPTASTEPSAGADGQDNLRNIGQRLLDLEDERSRIRDEYIAARDRMNEVAPLPPKPRPRKIEEGKPKPIFAKPLKKIVRVPGASGKDKFLEDTPADAYWRLRGSSENEMMSEKIYQISWRYQCALFSAARESGYADALKRLEEVNGQIRQTAAEAFEIKARTSFDVAMQGYALLEAFVAQDGRAHDKFAKALARSAIEILPLGGGGSRVAATVRTIAA
jgi:hypothetical protein